MLISIDIASTRLYNKFMNNRLCRKCNNKIPGYLKIGNKSHNLSKRKFCLDCSPFKKHNTIAAASLIKVSRKYKDWPEEKRKKHIKNILLKGETKKLKLVEMFGGCCKYCGYTKCINALTFHHLKPELKCFGLSKNNLWSKSWESVLSEAAKCELVCNRCHAEIEAGLNPNNN